MSFKAFAVLALVGLGQASPLNSQILQHDDVLVLRDGKAVVMKSWDYTLEEDKREVQRRKTDGAGAAAAARAAASGRVSGRGCEESTEVQVTTDTYFNNWDVAMSPVIGNTGSSAASVSVSSGYSVSDSISVTEGVSATLEAVLTVSMSLTYSETWTTSETTTFTFNVPSGQYGLVISNPFTHRVAGNVLSGCTDAPTSDAFSTDSFTSATYGSLSWVEGPITLCNSSTYPVPFCVGSGTHS